jgi:RimJ/RimL family protein N-acetyltransferase
MEVMTFDDPERWLVAVEPFLLEHEARHDLALGIADTLIRHPAVYPTKHLWSVERAGRVVGAALQTPPHNLTLARPADDDVLPLLADAIHGGAIDLPGVVGADPECGAFAHAWSRVTGAVVRRVMGQGVYALREVAALRVAPGAARKADRPEDLELILTWLGAFDHEVVPPEISADADQRRRRAATVFASDVGGFWLWEDDGRPVAMTGVGSFTRNGARIGPVYTPPDARGRGYATSLVAEVSRRQLTDGRSFCFLHTDLANQTSNAIYRRIGYEHVCDSAVLAFDAA